jgi:hypothetical protein
VCWSQSSGKSKGFVSRISGMGEADWRLAGAVAFEFGGLGEGALPRGTFIKRAKVKIGKLTEKSRSSENARIYLHGHADTPTRSLRARVQ